MIDRVTFVGARIDLENAIVRGPTGVVLAPSIDVIIAEPKEGLPEVADGQRIA